MRIEMWPVGRLRAYENNPRQNDKAVPQMVASIKEFGFAIPVLAQSDGLVIDGHLRLKAAVELNMAEVPVIPCDDWTPAQVKAFRLMVNRSVSWADWDPEKLAIEFAELKALNFDVTLTGFDAKELVSFMASTGNPAEDEAPPLPVTPASRTGDLWLLDGHRVLCGDSTNAADIARLMAEHKPVLMVTDPPYGVDYDPSWRDGVGGLLGTAHRTQRGKALNDDRVDWSGAFRLFEGDVCYVWHASMKTIESGTSLEAAGFIPRAVIIWRKQQPLFGQGHYHWQHEPCWYAVRKGGGAHWIGDRKQSTVWDVQNLNPTGNRNEEKTGHGSQKPIELMRRPILNHTSTGAEVYDPFLGSGSTLIAAELTERVCYGLEIAPEYVDVIVARWQTLTAREATLEGDGRTFAAISAERLETAKTPAKAKISNNISRPIKKKGRAA